ncbi:GNAT family N-acetyltransferase [Aquimarina agarivorans]|uniref:GNAT family N-acetyltransferase n=1 Tax=Aquimarina agarivorans TaxID=980584 RepID=UPI000248E78A|nr:GNAT family N-acetyltransferase [Aquimarina agarivorans]
MNKVFPVLQTNGFELRQFQNANLNDVFKALSNPEVVRYYGVSFSSLEETKTQMEWFKNLETTKTGIWWAIYDQNNVFCGGIGFNDIDLLLKKVEIGFWLLPEFWGRGIIKACAMKVFTYGFETLKLFKIEAFVETENKNCYALLKKLSFKYEKTLVNQECKNGLPVDIALFSKTPSNK